MLEEISLKDLDRDELLALAKGQLLISEVDIVRARWEVAMDRALAIGQQITALLDSSSKLVVSTATATHAQSHKIWGQYYRIQDQIKRAERRESRQRKLADELFARHKELTIRG